MILRRGYCDGPEGQIHWRSASPDHAPSAPDLYCFSPAPFGSIAYAEILPHLAEDRRVIALDYPGQGLSDGGSATPSIDSYAASMIAAMEALSGNKQVDLTGFHSGTLVAVEVALQAAHRTAKIALVDVPAFDPDTRANYLPIVGAPFEPSDKMESLNKAWDMAVLKRKDSQSLDECLEMFADLVGSGSRMNATFHAAFTYDLEAKFAALQRPVTIIASQSGLLEATRRAASLLTESVLVERRDIQGSVLNQNAKETARTILDSLA